MILASARVRCDCNRAVEVELRADDAPGTPEAIAVAYEAAAFGARLTATARGWAVGRQEVKCDLCAERPDAGTIYQDPGDG
jgi:hypothetical protein